jgi:hypothetical protein
MATTLLPGSLDGTLNDASEVTLVPPPGPGVQRIVKQIIVCNVDTGPVMLHVRLANSADRREIYRGTLQAEDTWVFGDGDVQVLDDPAKSIVAYLDIPILMSQPEFNASWSDKGTI